MADTIPSSGYININLNGTKKLTKSVIWKKGELYSAELWLPSSSTSYGNWSYDSYGAINTLPENNKDVSSWSHWKDLKRGTRTNTTYNSWYGHASTSSNFNYSISGCYPGNTCKISIVITNTITKGTLYASIDITSYNSSSTQTTTTYYMTLPDETPAQRGYSKTGYYANGWLWSIRNKMGRGLSGAEYTGNTIPYWPGEGITFDLEYNYWFTPRWFANTIYLDDKTFTQTCSLKSMTFTGDAATNGTGNYTYSKDSELIYYSDGTSATSSYFTISTSNNKPILTSKASTPKGTYKIVVAVKDTDSGSTATATYTITLVPLPNAYTIVPDGSYTITYNGEAQQLIQSFSCLGGSAYFAYTTDIKATPGINDWKPSIEKLTAKDVGTYYIWIKVINAGIYEDIAPTLASTCAIKPAISVYDNNKWQSSTSVKVYDGSKWVEATTIKVYTDKGWIEAN